MESKTSNKKHYEKIILLYEKFLHEEISDEISNIFGPADTYNIGYVDGLKRAFFILQESIHKNEI